MTQTRFGMPHGNCFAACVASILEVRLECVPHVMHYDTDWFPAFSLWSRRHGIQLLSHQWSEGLADYLRDHHRDVYAIVSGPAARGHQHCCVYRGTELAHDPHPDRTGLIEETSCDFLLLSDIDRLRAYRAWAGLRGGEARDAADLLDATEVTARTPREVGQPRSPSATDQEATR